MALYWALGLLLHWVHDGTVMDLQALEGIVLDSDFQIIKDFEVAVVDDDDAAAAETYEPDHPAVAPTKRARVDP